MPSAVTVAAGGTFDCNSLNTSIGSLAGAGAVLLGTGSLTVGTDNMSTSLTSVISGSGSIVKVGVGIWTVSGSSSYTGITAINGGTLNFNSLAALGAGTAININGGILQFSVGSAIDVSSRTLSIGINGATIDTNGNDVSFANAIGNAGTGSFTKTGVGTLTMMVEPAGPDCLPRSTEERFGPLFRMSCPRDLP